MIEIRQLRFRYREGAFALHVPDLRIDAEKSVAVIGPSGSGKTTLLHLMAGIEVGASGRLVVDGTDLTSLGDARRRAFRIRHIGLVFQEFELLGHLSVLDNILLPYRIGPGLRLSGAVRGARAAALAGQVGLGDLLRRPAGQLSQGEKQRVAICRALLPGARVLLADEPTGNLDPSNRQRVFDILFRQARDHHATLVTVTHDHDLLDRFDRVVDFSAITSPPSALGAGPEEREPQPRARP